MKAVVFDDKFSDKFSKNGAFDSYGFKTTINQVLSRNNVTKLVNMFSNRCYEVPSRVFSCQELTFFKLPLQFEGFLNLNELVLDRVYFGASLHGTPINLPQLTKLFLSECINVYNFKIKTTKLDHLIVITCPDAKLLQLLDHPSLTMVGIFFRTMKDFSRVERIDLVSMLSNLPRIEEFLIEGNLLKFLYAETVPKWLPHAIYSLKLLMLADIQLGDMDQLYGALCFLRNSPNLEKLSIIHSVMEIRVDVGPALNHLKMPNCLDCTLKQLQPVEIRQLKGSEQELLFITLLLAHSPYLEKMTIIPSGALGVRKVLDIARDVMRFPRASTKAELIT